jgi:hypothetical protein
MSQKHIAELYYIAMNDKDLDKASSYFHEKITLKTPMTTLSSKKEVAEAARNFSKIFESLTVREVVGNGDRVVVIYDLKTSIGVISTASLISCKNELILSIELFYDTRPFLQ